MNKRNLVFSIAICICCTLIVGAQVQSAGSAGEVKTQEIVFAAFKPFTSDSGWCSINLPSNWKITEKTLDDERVISVMDPTENAVVVIRAWTNETQIPMEEKASLLKGFLNDAMSGFRGFAMTEAKQGSDSGIATSFEYDSEINNIVYRMYGNSYIYQKGNVVAILSLIIPKEQFDKKKESVAKIVKSLKLGADVVR
jgi:hypothetical protein